MTNEGIMLGEWAQSTATPRHAIVGRFDAHGRFNHRIVAHDINSRPLASSTITAYPHKQVFYQAPFQGIDNVVVRDEVDRQLRLSKNQHL
jgi:hypothetical protein